MSTAHILRIFLLLWVQLVVLQQPVRANYFNQIQALWQHWNISLWQLESSRHFLKEKHCRNSSSSSPIYFEPLAALWMDCWELPVGTSLKFLMAPSTPWITGCWRNGEKKTLVTRCFLSSMVYKNMSCLGHFLKEPISNITRISIGHVGRVTIW